MLAERSEVASEAVRRLTAAEGLVLAHGDLQPANALIDAAGRACYDTEPTSFSKSDENRSASSKNFSSTSLSFIP
jgi:hypothetical protein